MNAIMQTNYLHNYAKLYEVVKVDRAYSFKIPTKGGWKGQILTYRLKRDAVKLAGRFEATIEG